ncbi:MAG TPA: 4-hydroxy-tetrahydrodipicolinate synthase [Longimicrobiales bacterium]|nr:4-hydroxy-tetrahydrodipicolinate synthase [Longimicrobiales bacterium]
MADPRFTGSGVAIVTPFDDQGVNERVLAELVEWHLAAGTDAIVVCGSTGEAATMSAAEQRRTCEVAVTAAAGRVPVIAGCGGSDTRQVAALGAQARAAGADAVLVSAPPYNKPPQRGLIAHFRAVLDAADLPLVVYNVPGRTSVNLLPATIAELAEDPRVIAVKEACGDISQIAELARLVAGRVALWSGNDDQIVPILALGGTGVISVLANVAPAETSRMVKRFLAGHTRDAAELQLRYLPLVQALFAEPNPIPVKQAVGMLGFDVGPLRLPLLASEPGTLERLRRALAEAGLLARSVA